MTPRAHRRKLAAAALAGACAVVYLWMLFAWAAASASPIYAVAWVARTRRRPA